MSILVILPAARSRLRARGTAAPAAGASGDHAYALSADGLTLSAHGACAAALLPRAATVVLALGDADVAWHRLVLPRAPAARLRAALAGAMEESLLDEPEALHFAIAPDAAAGAPSWVAVADRAWLAAELAALEAAQVFVDRIVPSSWPADPPTGHFFLAADDAGGPQAALRLAWSHAGGAAVLSLRGALARGLLAATAADAAREAAAAADTVLPATPPALPEAARWSAEPDAAAAAERWLDAPVTVLPQAERALLAARSPWNLRQFDLVRRSRGTRALRDTLRRLLSPAWRPARYGVAALVATQLVGLNVWAWRLDATVAEKRAEQVALLQQTHPQVRAVLDAPLQMRREAALLRAAAGRPDAGDLEPLLGAAAAAWPPAQPPVESLRYEPGRLTLAAPGLDPPQMDHLRGALRPAGVRIESVDGRLVLSRAAEGPAP